MKSEGRRVKEEEGKGICPELKGLWRLIGEHRKAAV